MYLKSQCCFIVPPFIILISLIPFCFSSYSQEDPYFITSSNQNNNHKLTFAPLLDNQANAASTAPKLVNVDDYGAKGDGTDDSEAFNNAWKEFCSCKGSVLVVPDDRSYHLKPITFEGPCQSDLIFKIYGTIKASTKQLDYQEDRRHWLHFKNLENFSVEGGGTINGNGQKWWNDSCKINKSLVNFVMQAITFSDCTNLIVANLRIKNAQQMHLTFNKSVNVKASNLMVIAPGKSPNTDGIHVTETQNIHIQNCVIRTGDDCISIVSGSKNVKATNIICGPGHGISIGSLGSKNSEGNVSNVLVDGAKMSNTSNGVRIKTWQGGSGYAKNIIFQNIVMDNVTNPIIIDQNYCDQDEPCKEQPSAVQVSNVVYKNIQGTSASKEAITFDCSNTSPCQGISLQNVHLALEDAEHGSADGSCANVNLTSRGMVSPKCS
ncbi:Glyco_hydro_28 domain-containing protein [Cephalotus follicularis]|uniref:endo-polygalacturonase n=1 Tax=Cephalotus follicularis TaxID=3775 RepID=A0A1Q3D0P7_CEPFO|nr:Glyco_hydro_28 domain-containing protein [Cephalotus follicularis]